MEGSVAEMLRLANEKKLGLAEATKNEEADRAQAAKNDALQRGLTLDELKQHLSADGAV